MRTIKTKWKKATATPKGRRIIFSILIFIFAAITAGIIYWKTNKKAIIKNKLETAVREKSDGLYKIKYDSLKMDEIAGYLSISNMNLSYDSTRYLELKKQGKASSILLNIHIPEITVSGVKTPRALIEKEIVARKLEIKNPVINIMYTNSGKDASRSVPSKAVYEQLLGNLDLIQADTVLISGAQITTRSLNTKKQGIQLQDVFITLVDVKVDSMSNADTTRIFFANHVNITCNKLAWSSANKLYNYSAGKISVNSMSRHLRINSFRIIPALNEEAFVKALPTQDDRFDFLMSNIEIQNVNMRQLFDETLVADNIMIPASSFKIYRDLAIPRDKKNRVGTYPHQLMETLPFIFRVKKLVLTNSFIEYKERNHITRQSGKVQFYRVNASINNFTNDKNAIATNNVMAADISASFLNKTPLKTSWSFYLLHPKGRFDVEGSLGTLDASLLNPLTEPMGPASIKEGKFNGCEFNLKGEDYSMDGTVKFLYEDLKVAMLEKDKGAKELDKKTLLSFLANMAIKNSNPKRNEEPRVAQVHHDRDVNRSIFYLTWKTVFKGIRETVGIKKQ